MEVARKHVQQPVGQDVGVEAAEEVEAVLFVDAKTVSILSIGKQCYITFSSHVPSSQRLFQTAIWYQQDVL